jgi:hypothetical protein
MNPLQMPCLKISLFLIVLKWAKGIFLRLLISHSGIRNKTTTLVSFLTKDEH